MNADVRAFEALVAHPMAPILTPRSALALLATIRAARGGYPQNLGQCIGWGVDLLQQYPYFRLAVEQEGPEQWAYQLRLIGLRSALEPGFARRLDRATADILASMADGPSEAGFFGVIMPQDALDYMNRVKLGVDLLNEDVRRSGIAKRDGAFYWAWSDWWVVWEQFYQEHLPWHARLNATAVYDETEVKERELKEWRKKFEERGGKPTSPEPKGPGVGGDDDEPSLGDIGMALAKGAVVVVGIGVVGYLVTRKR